MTEHNIHTRNRNKILRDLTGDDDFIFSAHKIFVTYLRNTKMQERKFQKRDVSRVTCLSKPITQQF